MVNDPRVELKHHADERYFMNHKVVLLGDSGVGKSSLFANFIKDLQIDRTYQPTLMPLFGKKLLPIHRLGAYKIHYNIWDTAGQKRYQCFS